MRMVTALCRLNRGEETLEQGLRGSDYLCRSLVCLLVADELGSLLVEIAARDRLLNLRHLVQRALRRLDIEIRRLAVTADLPDQRRISAAQRLPRQQVLV